MGVLSNFLWSVCGAVMEVFDGLWSVLPPWTKAYTGAMRLPLVAAVLCGFLALSADAQTKRPMTFADLQAMKRISDPQISPSGKWVLFSVTEVMLEKNSKVNHLWAVPLAGGKEVQLTSGTGETNGRFSPDGKWISYTSNETEGSQIWLTSFNDANGTISASKQLTHLSTEADGAIWSPDSKSLAFTSDVYSDCSGTTVGDDCNKQAIEDDAKSPVKALIFDHLLYRHWDHYQAPSAKLRPPVVPGKVEGYPPEIARLSHILMVHIDHPETVFDLTPPFDWGNDIVAPTFSLGGPLGYAFSPDSKELAFVVNDERVPAESTNNDIYVIDVTLHDKPSSSSMTKAQALGWAPKKVSSSPGSDDGPAYSPDGKWLAWRSQARNGYESDQFKLAVMDRQSGEVKLLDHVLRDYSASGNSKESHLDMWVDEFIWSDNSKEIFFVSEDKGEAPIYSIGIDGVELHRYGKALGEWGSIAEQRVKGNFTMIGSFMGVDHPAEIALVNVVDMDDSTKTMKITLNNQVSPKDVTEKVYTPVRLTNLNGVLMSQLDLSPQEPFWFAGANGTKVEGFLIKPPNFDASRKYPVKFIMHGGPQTALGDSWSYRWNMELFAANGYVVIGINRRGSTGYGQKFVEEVSGDWGGRPYVDLMKGLDYAEQHFSFIDKDRECALGASYGGFMADWVLTHTDRFKCIVTHDGMYNPQSAFGTTEEDWFNEWEFRPLAVGPKNGQGQKQILPLRQAQGQDDKYKGGIAGDEVVEQSKPAHPWDFYDLPADKDPFRKWSPMLSIKNAKTPTLVIHGQRDYRLDVSEGLQLFDALQMLGVPSKMVYFENEGHWVLKPKDSEFWYEQVDDWVDRWVKSGKYAAQ
jgi:dipeptidyl aminopeptidase/acylaminoacyl peptidase